MVTTPELIRAVSRVAHISEAKLAGKTRLPLVVHHRWAISFVIQNKERLSLAKTWPYLGYNDHSTLVYGHRELIQRMAEGREMAIRAYRTTIRCYVKLKQEERRRAPILAQMFEAHLSRHVTGESSADTEPNPGEAAAAGDRPVLANAA